MASAIFRERFYDLLLFSDLTENELHKKTGLPLKSVYNWTRGITYPNPNSLLILGDFFEISLDYILGLDDREIGGKKTELTMEKAQANLLAHLNNYIKEKGITKYRLAKLLDTRQTALTRWFNENTMPGTEKLILISKLLDKPLDELLGRR